MATVEVGNGPVLDVADRVDPRRSFWRGPRFIAEVFDGADDALAALEAVQRGSSSNGFQTLDWLTVLYEELAPSQRATPRVVVVSERNAGDVAMILPLIVQKKRTLRVARFADLGVSDYGGPILGPAVLKKPRSIRLAWRAARRAMRDIDLIRLERMPVEIAGRPNPLLTRAGITPAHHSSNQLVVATTVKAYLASLGKKHRKEVERCVRRWEQEGATRFYRATTPEEIARVFSVLEEQQAARHASLGSKYILDEPGYRAFYERVAMDGSEAGLAALFALEAKGEIIATLFGIVHDGVFTLLRISTAGEAWSHVSPGRLVVIEAMKYFVGHGVRRFDFGIGDYPFKRSLGAREVPLFDLIVARDLAGWPRAVYHRWIGRMRKNKVARAVFQRLRPSVGR